MMDAKEALKELEDLTVDYGDRNEEQIARLDEAIDMAMDALRNLPNRLRQAMDTINRKEAIDEVCKAGCGSGFCGVERDEVLALRNMPSAQPETHEERTETHACDCISRQAAIDDAHAMPDFEKVEKVIIDNLYVGDKKVTDLIASGRLRLVGFCKECKHCFPPLVCKVDGEVVQVTSDRCSIWNGYVEKNGWCYKFEMRTDMRGEQDE